ncbi:MAG: TspO/MBR family protein [Chitinophagaceae bacterium]
MTNSPKFIVALLIPLAIGGISGYITATNVEGWFSTIQKPSFNPPNAVFAPVWTTLYFLMGIGLFLVWKQPKTTYCRTTAIAFFIVQLALNFFWSILFFNLHHPALAFLDIVLLWISILLMTIFFYKVKPLAGLLQIPYICWVSFASVLNYSIWQLNK